MSTSIVIPTYYRPDDLSELLDSLLNQTAKPVETIVVDDTPTNLVKIVCEEYEIKFESKGSRLIYIKNPRERSAAIARNIGTERAIGDIVVFLDSDVVIYPDYIEKITAIFKEHPNALGVQGWDVNARKVGTHLLIKAVQTFFRLKHYVKDSCKFAEYPYLLTKTINCEYLHGSNFAVKRDVLAESRFDETLKKYSYMEDLLFSYSIYQKYASSLYITPSAKCMHKGSKEGRMETAERRSHLRQCRKHVLTKLFGVKGSLIYYWQSIGMLVIDLAGKIWGFLPRTKHEHPEKNTVT